MKLLNKAIPSKKDTKRKSADSESGGPKKKTK